MSDALDLADPQTWPDDTVILRGGVGDASDLASRADALGGGWSVQAQPGLDVIALAGFVPNNRVRRTTLGQVRKFGEYLVNTPGPGYHRSLRGMHAIMFDRILGEPELNPVAPTERWPNR